MRETVARISATFTNGRHLRDGSSTATDDAGASSVEYGLLVAAIAAVIVAIICDRGDRYLSTGVFSRREN